MTPKLYINEICPSVRAVLLSAKVLGLTLELRNIELSGITTELFVKHPLPLLEDRNFRIWDSHAIIAYLIGKYGKDDALYPKNSETRALIDERLHFDSGVLAFFTETILNPLIYGEKKQGALHDYEENLDEIYTIVEGFFGNEDNEWIAGSKLSIADLCLIPSITSMDVLLKIDQRKYPKIIGWIRRAEMMLCYSINEDGLRKLRDILMCRKLM